MGIFFTDFLKFKFDNLAVYFLFKNFFGSRFSQILFLKKKKL